jgi:hypothetical protein
MPAGGDTLPENQISLRYRYIEMITALGKVEISYSDHIKIGIGYIILNGIIHNLYELLIMRKKQNVNHE